MSKTYGSTAPINPNDALTFGQREVRDITITFTAYQAMKDALNDACVGVYEIQGDTADEFVEQHMDLIWLEGRLNTIDRELDVHIKRLQHMLESGDDDIL